jgi:hypothetical protein
MCVYACMYLHVCAFVYASVDECATQFFASAMCARFVEVLRADSTDAELARQLCRVVSNLALVYEQSRVALFEANVHEALSSLVTKRTQAQVRSAALGALSQLALSYDRGADTLTASLSAALPALLYREGKGKLLDALLRLLINLTAHPSAVARALRLVGDAEKLFPFARALVQSAPSAQLQVAGAKLLTNLCTQLKQRVWLRANDGVPRLRALRASLADSSPAAPQLEAALANLEFHARLQQTHHRPAAPPSPKRPPPAVDREAHAQAHRSLEQARQAAEKLNQRVVRAREQLAVARRAEELADLDARQAEQKDAAKKADRKQTDQEAGRHVAEEEAKETDREEPETTKKGERPDAVKKARESKMLTAAETGSLQRAADERLAEPVAVPAAADVTPPQDAPANKVKAHRHRSSSSKKNRRSSSASLSKSRSSSSTNSSNTSKSKSTSTSTPTSTSKSKSTSKSTSKSNSRHHHKHSSRSEPTSDKPQRSKPAVLQEMRTLQQKIQQLESEQVQHQQELASMEKNVLAVDDHRAADGSGHAVAGAHPPMTAEERTRRSHIAKEVLSTEKTYVESLRLLVGVQRGGGGGGGGGGGRRRSQVIRAFASVL